MNEPTGIEELVRQGREAFQKRNLPQAIAAFEAAVAQAGTRLDIRNLLAQTYFVAKEYDKSLEQFQRIIELDPLEGNALVNMGAIYNRKGEFKQAIDVLRRGLRKVKNSAEAYYNLGISYRGQGQTTMAVSAYREAIRLNPEMADAHQNLANLYIEVGNTQQAISHYKKALEINPNFERARQGLSKALGAADEARQAVSPFGRLVDAEKYTNTAPSEPTRELTSTERFEDRRKLHAMTGDIRTATEELVQHLRETMIPCLMTLTRAVAQSADAPFRVEQPLKTYQQAILKNQELRRLLKRKMLELRAHEELINTPNLSSDKE